jgi:hypothetical protein
MHTTEIVKTVQNTDEAISVTIRCCSNPKTDSVLTLYAHNMSQAQIEAAVAAHHDKVAGKCTNMAKAKAHLVTLTTQKKTHEAK